MKRELLIVIIILLAVAFGVIGLQADSMWHDEQLSLLYAGGLTQNPINPLDTITRILDRGSGQAPFYYMLLSVWGSLIGWTVFSARAFSLIVGVLAIAWVYRLGREMHSPFAGFCSAVILGSSAFFSAYLHEIRTYSLLVLEILIVLDLYWHLFRNPKSSYLTRILFIILVTATLYTHPFAIGAIGALGIYHLIFAPKSRAWVITLVLFGVAGVLFLPWAVPTLGVIANRVEDNTRTLTIRTNAEVIRDMLHAFSNGVWIFLLMLVPSLTLLRQHHGVRLLWVMAFAFAGVMLGANQISDMINHVRYLMPLLPLVALLMGIGLASLIAYRNIVWIVLIAWAVVGFISAPTFGNLFYTPEEHTVFHFEFPFQQVSEDTRAEAVNNDAIVYYIPYHGWAVRGIIDYYMQDIPARHILTDTFEQNEDMADVLAGFRMFLGDAGRVWFILDKTVEPTEHLAEYEAILDDYVFCKTVRDTEQVRVQMFAQIEALCEPDTTPVIRFGETVELLDFVYVPEADYHAFYSLWSNHIPADTYSLSLQFMDESGEGIFQVDNPLPIGDFSYRIDRIPRQNLPDEAITVNAIVYAWQTGERLRTSDDRDIYPLTTINED